MRSRGFARSWRTWSPGGAPVVMTIGDPRHGIPGWVGPMLAAHAAGFGSYPENDGSEALLEAISAWLGRRYGARMPTSRILALNGTREGLFAASMALSPEEKGGRRPAILIPNPFYQAYAVGALGAGAEPVFVPASEGTGWLPDYAALPAEVLDRTTLAFVCSPSNPQGAVAPEGYLADLLALAERHGFRVLADECYSEIWYDAPPPGLLEVAGARDADPERAMAFHSLSKRSSAAGLRSGFVAGGPQAIGAMRQLRGYGGAPVPGPIQAVSARLWSDEDHVDASRALYAEKRAMASQVLDGVPGAAMPEGGFFLWLPAMGDAEDAARRLWREAGVKVLPGHYLAREVDGAAPASRAAARGARGAAGRNARTGCAACAPASTTDGREPSMAYQTRRREPLVDETTAAALARRGREAVGLGLLLAGGLLGAALWSYAPADPGWFGAGGEGRELARRARRGDRLARAHHARAGQPARAARAPGLGRALRAACGGAAGGGAGGHAAGRRRRGVDPHGERAAGCRVDARVRSWAGMSATRSSARRSASYRCRSGPPSWRFRSSRRWRWSR